MIFLNLNMSDIIVSVCCLAYNHEPYIRQCLDGFVMQKTNFKFEVLIHDDASTDGTEEIIRDFERRYPSIIKPIYEETNQWVKGRKGSAVFNFPRAKGKYIALCEGDDYWTDPLKLQKQVDFLEGNLEYSGCFHNTMILNEIDGSNSLKPWRYYQKQIFTLEDTISKTALFHTSSFLFRTESLNIPDWFKEIQSGDMAIFSLTASKGNLYRINDDMSVYRKNVTGITNTISITSYHKNRIILFEYLHSFIGESIFEKTSSVINYHKKELLKLKNKNNKPKTNNIILKIKNKLKKIIG